MYFIFNILYQVFAIFWLDLIKNIGLVFTLNLHFYIYLFIDDPLETQEVRFLYQHKFLLLKQVFVYLWVLRYDYFW